MLKKAAESALKTTTEALKAATPALRVEPLSEIMSISAGTAEISGLKDVRMNELVLFKNNVMGMVQTLKPDSVGVVFLSNPDSLKAGDKVRRTNRVLDVPVGDALLGRVIDPLGTPLDELGPLNTDERRRIETDAAPIMDRAPVDTPLQTGIKVVDAFTPIGRGQRELILGDRQTGKTALALDTIINQKDTGVLCIYCSIGARAAGIARVIADLKKYGVMQNTIVMAATGDDEAGMQYIAPYAATAIGEYFMYQGRDVLIVYDDLTAHARAYRQISLLLRTPPGREAFPGDIFYIHSRLLERATHLRPDVGGGSLTALPIVTTEAGNISAYIPTNIISITDGQIYLSLTSYQKGILPAVDTGPSVSRVGGDAQLPAYRKLIGPLKLFYAQFEELESFAKFGTQLDSETQDRLKRGHAIRAALQQMQYRPMAVETQVAVWTAVNAGLFDDIPADKSIEAQTRTDALLHNRFPDLIDTIVTQKQVPTDQQTTAFLTALRDDLTPLYQTEPV